MSARLESHTDTSLGPSRSTSNPLHVNVPRKAEDGPCAWALTPTWKQLLTSAWSSRSHYSHLRKEPADGRPLSASLPFKHIKKLLFFIKRCLQPQILSDVSVLIQLTGSWHLLDTLAFKANSRQASLNEERIQKFDVTSTSYYL